MEHLDPRELDIPRTDREAEICIDGIAYIISTNNTTLWRYPERYQMFNHLTISGDTGYRMFFGLNDKDMEAIASVGVTQVLPPYPSDDLISDFWTVEMNDYDRELAEQEGRTEEE